MNYIATIGLEVHVQLKTRSKMFCACPVEFGAAPNTHTCPICLGLPGALPAMNHEALRMTVLTGLMLDCDIAPICKFDRKNYFYPDMPKNYQISQYDMPLCENGAVPLHDLAYPKDAQKNIATPDKEVHLVRIHLEEDVAKSFHFETNTGIDFNRAGTPLMEIVTQPEINSPEEAFAFLTSLKQILIYGGVSDADMEKGQLRCDCNVSVRPEKQAELGAKIEIKNMNSISGVRRALAFEIQRQIDALERGEKLQQEARGWDDVAGETFLMRTKEFAHDYRYFPDPDLVPVKTEALLGDVRGRVPELPKAKRARFVEQYRSGAVLRDRRQEREETEEHCQLDPERFAKRTQHGRENNQRLPDPTRSARRARQFDRQRPDQWQTRQGSFRGDVRDRQRRGGNWEGKGNRAIKRHGGDRQIRGRSDRRESETSRRFQSG